ncbi:lytic transglycosylase domain-containing protein [Bacillus haikouensis]|jgi:peptidoglycan LD-endopeptidase LytH|uniref:lytic transglycosylase domain-containing protein n=1 Tax=Bacillus haikouensis TaxID=1510468 RepID=UPI001552E35D|nr:lytic transglycosylase domain-containing protein [Bacillus haikouensis]NQD65069.1 lytic transglycosylase domain-containing protein [Bacillus haikouensis]
MPTKTKKKKTPKKNKHASPFIILLIPILILAIYFTINSLPISNKLSLVGKEEVPSQYIPIYKAAEKEYGVPWNLLAAHHRVETRFSTMKSLISPVGAEGHMQFMPCTFVGWSHPTCGDLGKGDIPEEQKTDPRIIEKYGGYGVDGNGDGLADPFQIEDAVFSAANYLARNGAARGEIEQAVFAYNHSDKYVEDVLYFAERYIEKSEESDNQQ